MPILGVDALHAACETEHILSVESDKKMCSPNGKQRGAQMGPDFRNEESQCSQDLLIIVDKNQI